MAANLDEWRDYALLRGNTAVEDADDDLANQALQRAKDYIRTRYVLRLAPAYNDESPEVVEAVYIAAGYELTTPNFWSRTFTPNGVKVLTEAPEVKWTLVDNKTGIMGVDSMLPTSPAIDALFFGATSFNLGPLLA